ncbi:MAG TPA: biotin carboxylase N-terminal domain-containing protein [Blastocatellia bacterium]|nr:biotin carboxylase N-terminal domain-containing protein [Blastocatellia bacterium]
MTKSIQKVLVANRGEIAVRIFRSCAAMGMSTIAVYSDADRDTVHVRAADEGVRIGPPPPLDSYLNIGAIIDAADRAGADAIHPGYGFLSESADFAAACESAGIIFIGPRSDVIRQMGLKSVARGIARQAGVPVVPGYDGADQSSSALRGAIQQVGFPVLIKASAGGGGRGMRIVRTSGEIDSAIDSARRESEKAFGDGSLLIEKYIERPRHVEVQILGDHFGNIVHLFERDCSIQRRHQKIIEESPSPALTPELRERMCAAAVALGRAIGYTNAGTVEFILAPTGEFFFIETNTRLQVEHPVTEMITGLDLVQLQIEIAEGKPLPFDQTETHRSGCAIEARLYAEDPENDFLPTSGVIQAWEPPPSTLPLRFDAGVDSNSDISIHYDPLLAKLISHGADREAARRRLVAALRDLIICGPVTNREFLIRTLEQKGFLSGEYDTGFVNEHASELLSPPDPDLDFDAAAVAALYLQQTWHLNCRSLPHIPPVFRNNPYRDPSVSLCIQQKAFEIAYRHEGEKNYTVSCGDRRVRVRLCSFEPGRLRLEMDGIQRTYRVIDTAGGLFVHSSRAARTVTRVPRYPDHRTTADDAGASAPMPGQVLKILVDEGQRVSAGDPLIVLEAMKIEQTVRATVDGTVEAVHVRTGDVVAPGEMLVRIAAH